MTALTHDQARQFLEMGREQLSGEERAALDRHVTDCAECQAYAAELAALQTAVGRVMRNHWKDMRPDPQLEDRIQVRVRTQTMPKRILNNALGAAALLVFTIIVIALFSARTQPTAIDSPAATPMGSPFPAPTPLSGRDFYQLQRLTTMSQGATGTEESGASQPAVSPDGRRVVYSGRRVGDGNSEIYVLDLTTLAETRLTDDPRTDIAPTWSPDGTRIAYERLPVGAIFADLVDHIVMNADGSNPQVMFSGAQWASHTVPAWSPSGDRIAFMDYTDLVIVNVNDRREIRRFGPVEERYISQQVWFDEDRILFIDKGAVKLGNVATGAVESIAGPTGSVSQVMALGTEIAYVQQDGSTARAIRQDLGGTYSKTMGIFDVDGSQIETASWSPDGRFVAVQTLDGLYVATEHVPASWQHAAMFNLRAALDFPIPVRVSWLPDSSGFVVEHAFNIEQDLYLVRLNMGTIKIVEDNAPVAQVPPLLAIPTLAPTPTQVGTPFPTITSGPTASPTPPAPTPVNEWSAFRMELLTTTAFNGYRPAVSPDGQRVIYADERDGNAGIFALDLKTREVTRLTTDTFRDLEASWSSDGARIAYQHVVPSSNGSTSTIERIVINADGSNKQVVASGAPWSAGSEAPAWSPDGTRLAFTDNTELVVIDVADGRELKRFSPVDVLIHNQPAWLDDQHILFVSEKAVKVASLATGVIEKMVNTSDVIQAAVMPPDIVYIRQADSTAHVIRLKLDGSQSLIGVLPAGLIGGAASSPDGRFVAVETAQGLYVVTADMPASRQLTPLIEIHADSMPMYSRGVSWLPDSFGFVFVAEPDSQPALYLARPDPEAITFGPTPVPTPFLVTSPTLPPTPPTPAFTPTPFNDQSLYQAERLTTSGDMNQPAISPDGRRLIYTSPRGGNWDVYLLDLTTKVETRLTNDPRNDMAPSWSPDGAPGGVRIAYQRYAQSETGPELVDRVVMNADGSNPQVVASGAERWSNERPAWSPAGDRLAFTDGTQLVIVNIDAGRELRRFELVEKPFYNEPVWFDEDRILFIDQGVLQVGNVATGISERVPGPSAYVSHVMVMNAAIAYVQQEATTAQVIGQSLDGTHAFTLTTFQVNPIPQSGPVQSAALSPNGRFVAAQIDQSLYVAYITTEQPLSFNFPTHLQPTDLAGITWLLDSSGFICLSASEGQLDLYLVRPIPGFEQLEPYWLGGIPGALPPTPTSTAIP